MGVEPGGATTQGAPPAVDAAHGGGVTASGPCVTFRPTAAVPAATMAELKLTVPPEGLRFATASGAAAVTVRRFAGSFPEQPLSRLAASSRGTLRIAGDRAAAPWHVRVAPEAAVTACRVAGP